ncbi:MAG: SDR family NAD(P)-dependent oxidoreductase, partial [SAR324 cluster bacterium]|nr:SDR family NAD(P)-dependent oxidoreductase [SAR324 cluster bacterium]
MSNPDGSDRVCLVTGAARGNGLAIARALTDSGATVYLADIARDLPDVPYALATPREFDEAVESLQTIHNRVYGIRFDVRDAKAAARAVTQIETEQGRLDILVNNAGVLVLKPLPDLTDAEWEVQLDVIAKG